MADAVRSGTASAAALVQASLDRIEATDGRVNAFTDIVRARALRRAAQVDASLASAHAARTRELPLLGVPFAVKNLFDIAGLPTLAGSKIERESAPARGDALLVRRLESAGAVLVGALNMDEYAYGFTTENSEASICAARRSARSRTTSVKAFTRAFVASMRSRLACTSATALTDLDCTAAAMAEASFWSSAAMLMLPSPAA